MSAATMKHDYRNDAIDFIANQAAEMKKAVNLYLSEIIKFIDDCGGLIHEGNFNMFTRTNPSGERVVYFYGSWLPYDANKKEHYDSAIELYSEDGWEKLEDIANWVDVAKDYRDRFVSERDKDKVGMSADEILEAVAGLACSQGSYGRLLMELRANPDTLQKLVDKKFSDTLDMILYIEEA
jgi:hypothetical protein